MTYFLFKCQISGLTVQHIHNITIDEHVPCFYILLPFDNRINITKSRRRKISYIPRTISSRIYFETLEEAILYCTLHNIKYYNSEILDKLHTARNLKYVYVYLFDRNIPEVILNRTPPETGRWFYLSLKNAIFEIHEFEKLTNEHFV